MERSAHLGSRLGPAAPRANFFAPWAAVACGAALLAWLLVARGTPVRGGWVPAAIGAGAAAFFALAVALVGRRRVAPADEQVSDRFRLAQLLARSDLDHLTLLDPDGTLLFGGRAFGLDPSCEVPRDRFRRVLADDRAGVFDWLSQVRRESGTTRAHTYRVRDAAGAVSEVRSSASNMVDVVGVGAIVIATQAHAGERERQLSLTLHDPLTGLPSRSMLVEEIRTAADLARAAGRHVAVVIVDLDRFKVANDSLGHREGDELLRRTSERIRLATRPTDMASRLSGDEFAVLCRDLATREEALAVAQTVLEAVAQPVVLGTQSIVLTASAGIAVASAAIDPEEVLRDADIALSRAKQKGGGAVETFDPALRVMVTKRLDTEQELRRGLDSGQLKLLFQPIVSLTEGLVAAEALVRWDHPTRGVLSPGEFLPIAEETGLILRLGDQVLAEACRAARRWVDLRGEAAPRLTVNLSLRQLIEPSFLSRLRLHLAEAAVDPRFLIMEVTEDSLVNDLDRCIPVLSELAAMGFGIAIDDFGTGLSSLSHVKRLPMARTLKIDRSFVSDIFDFGTDYAIVQAVLVMARRLGIRVVAEGVETNEQLSALVELGCEYLQGYFFSPPLAEEALLAFEPERVLVHGMTLGTMS